jgi:hypothetical protein
MAASVGNEGSKMNWEAKKSLKKLVCAGISIFFITASAKATLVDSNSIVDLGIEYYIQTDKPVYCLGENVEMLFRVTNLRDEEVLIGCSRTPEFNLLVQKDVETIWMKVYGWYWHSPGITLSPGESKELAHSWDMKDKDGFAVDPGTYTTVGLMYNELWNDVNHGEPTISKVGIPITIIPEPGSLLLFVTSLTILLFSKRKRGC